jgi:hypothetical protein
MPVTPSNSSPSKKTNINTPNSVPTNSNELLFTLEIPYAADVHANPLLVGHPVDVKPWSWGCVGEQKKVEL